MDEEEVGLTILVKGDHQSGTARFIAEILVSFDEHKSYHN